MKYTESIIQTEKRCYICARTSGKLHIHHCLSGTSDRELSEDYALKIYLCPQCHSKVHDKHMYETEIKQMAQRKFEEVYGTREDFIRIFGKSFL